MRCTSYRMAQSIDWDVPEEYVLWSSSRWRWNMKSTSNYLIVALLLFAAATPLSSQNAPAKTSDADHAKHSLAVNLLRAINTAEVVYKNKHNGLYAAWDVLLASEEFRSSKSMQWVAKIDPELANAQFSAG